MNGLPRETQDQFIGALGQALVRVWGNLPQVIQQELFETAATRLDETSRRGVAVFLHDKHPRTTDAIKARAIPEPDSRGG